MKPGWLNRATRWVLVRIWYRWWLKYYLDPAPVMKSSLSADQREYVDELFQSRNRRRQLLVVWAIVYAAIRLVVPEQDRVGAFTVREVLYFVMIVGLAVSIALISRISVSYNIVRELLTLLRRLEENQETWPHIALRRWLNFDIVRLAKFLSRLPLALGTRHPNVVLTATRKAAAVRDLQVSVSKPNANTYQELYNVLLDDLKKITNREWHELPEADPDATARLSTTQRVGYVVLGVLLAVGAAAVFVRGKDWGAPGQFAGTVLAVGAYLSLGRAGVIPGSLQQALDTAAQVKKDVT